jgi:hypothetical protein
MKSFFLFLILFAFSNIMICQEKSTIDLDAKIVQSTSGIYKLTITFEVDTSLYTISMFQDTSLNLILPIVINFKENNYLKPIETWVENPKAKKINHRALGEGLYIKQKTSYTHKFVLKKRINFTSYIDVSYWAVNERKAEPLKTIKFKIIYLNNVFKIKRDE